MKHLLSIEQLSREEIEAILKATGELKKKRAHIGPQPLAGQTWGLIFSNGFSAALSANAIAYILIATGLNVHFGYSGLVNFGQAGFAAVGAYAVAIGVGRYDWNPVLGLAMVRRKREPNGSGT